MIQSAFRFVSNCMQQATHCQLSPGESVGPIALRLPMPAAGRARRTPPPMSGSKNDNPTIEGLSGLICAIATHRDRTAFATLFQYFAPRVKAFMQRSGIAEAAAEELAQETMLTVWRKAELFDPQAAGAATWIFTIARNLRIDSQRRQRRGGIVSDTYEIEAEFHVDDSPQPDQRVAAAQSEQRVRSALDQLSAEQLRVIELSFFEEKAHAEISQILEIPLGTVKSRLRLAMARLRILLGELS
jgi:RNA polymerase sigma-70 factor (ECF subfamily)